MFFNAIKAAAIGAMSYAKTLFAMRVHGETGVYLGPDGTLEVSAPNPAALWPPHRMHPTRPKAKKGRAAHTRMAVIDGRVSIADVAPKLQGGKGLRP